MGTFFRVMAISVLSAVSSYCMFDYESLGIIGIWCLLIISIIILLD